jgi:serine/threonine protein kinase
MNRPLNHSRGLHISGVLTQEEVEYLKKTINESTCEDLNNLCSRIGSISEDAIVYKCYIGNIPVAVKIDNIGYEYPPEELGVTSADSFEYDFSKWISSNDPQYFVRTIAHKYCPLITNGQISFHSVIHMELVAGDLRQVIEDGTTSKILDNYVRDVFESNIILSESGYIHGDMHLGNIFIRHTGRDTVAILGDFGKSRPARFNTSHLADMTKFFTGLKAITANNQKLQQINKKVTEYYKILSKKLENYPDEWTPQAILKDSLTDWDSLSF